MHVQMDSEDMKRLLIYHYTSQRIYIYIYIYHTYITSLVTYGVDQMHNKCDFWLENRCMCCGITGATCVKLYVLFPTCLIYLYGHLLWIFFYYAVCTQHLCKLSWNLLHQLTIQSFVDIMDRLSSECGYLSIHCYSLRVIQVHSRYVWKKIIFLSSLYSVFFI